MSMKSYNSRLIEIYKEHWDKTFNLLSELTNDNTVEVKPANPFLLSIENEDQYKDADLRVMIFGQETNGWYEKNDPSIENLQKLYNEFFHGGECWNYGGQFWNGFKRLKSSINSRIPNKKIEFIWNNIVKIGKRKEKGFPPDYIYEIERQFFNVTQKEYQVLKPEVVIFFTGPNYDVIIKDKFGELVYSECSLFTTRELAKIDFLETKYCFRTYHPNYLFRNNIDDYVESISEHLS